MTKFIFMRHGQSTGNVQRILSSEIGPFPLTELGKKQARAQKSNPNLNCEIAHVFVSPLTRTRETYEAIASVNPCVANAPMAMDDRLRELGMGGLNNRSIDNPDNLKIWLDSYENHRQNGQFDKRPAGDGETFNELQSRIAGFLIEMIERFPAKNVMAVSHMDLITAADSVFLSISGNNRQPVRPANAEIISFELDETALPKLHRIAEMGYNKI